LYQVQVEKFSNSLQKVVCPSCQSFHYFGTKQDTKQAGEPTIEKVFSQSIKVPATDPKLDSGSIDQEIFWRCGVCESSYHFNLNKVTSQGIKVTCTTCFCFFVLQKVGVMVDLDHMLMHEVSADKPLPSTLPPDELAVPPMIDINEVSGKFNLQSIQEALAEAEAQEHTVKTEIKPIPTVSVPTPKLQPIQPKSTMPAPPSILSTTSNSKPNVQSQIQRATTPAATPQPAVKISDRKSEIKEVDKALVNSFKSFNSQRKEFKFNPAEVSTEFVEHNPQRKKNLVEEYMVQVSIWIAGVSILSLAIVFGWEWYETKKLKDSPPPPVPVESVPTDQTTPTPDKPQYGFPVLED
jgi:hypothetical protein